jgi:tetratricopeptide (TPR) repeat protein
MGYTGVGVHYFNLGQEVRASEYYTKAFQLREHTSEREKLAITADYHEIVTGDLDKAAQAYRELIKSYPSASFGPYGNLATVFAAQGQYEKAAETIRHALSIAPDRLTFPLRISPTISSPCNVSTKRGRSSTRPIGGKLERADMHKPSLRPCLSRVGLRGDGETAGVVCGQARV